ncbi:hypothetical protein P9112_007024 [Eukaryota sp. TZLM1-RC]
MSNCDLIPIKVAEYKAYEKASMINRHGAVRSFTHKLCDQLAEFVASGHQGSTEKPFINAIIGNRGSGKTTFGTCCLHSLVTGDNSVFDDLQAFLGHNHPSNGPCMADLLAYLYLSGRFVAMELPDGSFQMSHEYILKYFSQYLDIDYIRPELPSFFS